ncbi:MAG: glycosyltransferase family 2 protein [Flavobacteriales bacterium]|nr:glycosyltransferase family 2 protein [Flavobacteriales bacterium]
MELQIAVVIPVYNAGRFVRDAVASALRFAEVKEVVLVEDASPDNSLEVCQALVGTDPRIRLLRHPDGRNHGAGASRNVGFNNSTSPLVVFLDADDYFLPNRFDRERIIFAEHPDADGVYGATGSVFYDPEARRKFMEQCPEDELTTVGKEVPPEHLFSALLGRVKGFGYFHLDAFTIRRSAVERLGLSYPTREEVWHEDTEYCLKLAQGARLYAGDIVQPVAMRGVHDLNRYTAIEDIAATRHVLYQRLERWSYTVRMQRKDRHVLIAKRVFYGVYGCRTAAQRWAHGRHFLRHPWLFGWVQPREAWTDALFGKGTRMAGRARSLMWRLFPCNTTSME